ncbi:MAG: ArsR/SmtB family transcription factor [Nannocystaceae bacterium]
MQQLTSWFNIVNLNTKKKNAPHLGSEAQENARLDRVFRALSHTTRRAILKRLQAGSAMVGELAEPFSMSLPAVSKHLRVLEQAGLVTRHVDGRVHNCTLRPEGLREIGDWLHAYRIFWEDSLASLADFVEQEQQSATPTQADFHGEKADSA